MVPYLQQHNVRCKNHCEHYRLRPLCDECGSEGTIKDDEGDTEERERSRKWMEKLMESAGNLNNHPSYPALERTGV